MKQKLSKPVKVVLILTAIITSIIGVKLFSNYNQNKQAVQTIADISQKYPATKTNQSAVKLDELIILLGLDAIASEKQDSNTTNSKSELQENWQKIEPKTHKFLELQLEKTQLKSEPIPSEITNYLEQNRSLNFTTTQK